MVDLETIHLELKQVKTPEEDLLSSEFQKNLAHAIKSLPAKSQLVYKLIKEEGFSYKQVADVLEISVNTVEGHMSTALKKLSTILSAYLRSGK
jgi:RNA polymerase sigma-70 factor (ECF subfamily)